MLEDSKSSDSADFEPPAKERLIYTKLAIPLRFHCLVSRPHLVSMLDQVGPGNVTLVTAPAGFGKTTLISEWSGRHDGLIAWLSLDEADNEAIRFWSYVLAALHLATVQVSDRVAEILAQEEEPDWELFISLLLHEIGEHQQTITLVLDDYHLIQANAIHYHLGYILRRQPGQLRVIILSRADPPLALARLRLEARLLELRASDLRFSRAEMVAFFNCALPYRLSQSLLKTLFERIEGWAAGLRLAALSLQELEKSEASAFVQAFSGAERYVFHYLLEEVLQRQPPHIQAFLLHTSVLRHLHPLLCAAVTGFEDAARILEQMAEENLFIMRLEGVSDWYRYHRLFAGALRNRLAQTEPDLIPELRQRALDWYADLGERADLPMRIVPAMMREAYRLDLDEDDLPIDHLTEREAEILVLIAQGLSNQQIAEQLVVSVGTVKGHINHLFSKLDAHSRTEALAKARRLGLLQP